MTGVGSWGPELSRLPCLQVVRVALLAFLPTAMTGSLLFTSAPGAHLLSRKIQTRITQMAVAEFTRSVKLLGLGVVGRGAVRRSSWPGGPDRKQAGLELREGPWSPSAATGMTLGEKHLLSF